MEEKKLSLKEKLLEEVKELEKSEEVSNLFLKANQLKRKWRTNDEEESFYEKELKDEFDSYLNKIYEKAGVVSKSARETKEEIIQKAQELLKDVNLKKASDKMNDLMNEWKASGRTSSKEEDDELWSNFKAVKNEFYDKKKEYFQNLRQTFEENKTKKEALIEEATAANEIENIKELTEKMTSLMEEWKKTGSSGRKQDNELWDKFLAQRQLFNAKRKEYYNSMKETFAQRAQAKKDIISEAKHYLAMSEFNQEEVNAVKELRNKWKEVGNSGKDNEDKLWEEFNTVVNKYFTNKRESQ